MAEKDFMYGAAERLREKLNDLITKMENPYYIILEIAKLLGEMSGEKNYYRTVQEQLHTNYGLILKDKFVLNQEIKLLEERLKKIEAAYNNPDFAEDEHQRIGFALARHKAEIERLKNMHE